MSEPIWTMSVRDPGCGWLSANGSHGSPLARSRKVKKWRTRSRDLATYLRVPRLQHARIVVVVHRAFGVGRADANNLQPTAKAVVDGLVDAGLLPDDDDTRLQGPDMRPGPNVARGRSPHLEVLVYPHPDHEGATRDA